MRRTPLVIACLTAGLLMLLLAGTAREPSLRFTPHTATVPALIDQIAQARKSIDIATYSLHDSALAKMLSQKVYDGVRVQVIVDRQPLSWRDMKSSAPGLHDSGATVRLYGLEGGTAGKLRNFNLIVIDPPSPSTGGTDSACAIVLGGPLVRADLESGVGTAITLTDPQSVADAAEVFNELMTRSARFVPPHQRRDAQGKPKPAPKPGF